MKGQSLKFIVHDSNVSITKTDPNYIPSWTIDLVAFSKSF